jgi:carbonic anhydrase
MIKVRFVFEYDPASPDFSSQPASPAEAFEHLEKGNRAFGKWIKACRNKEADRTLVVPTIGLGRLVQQEGVPVQSPFAVIVGCSDARMPLEMIFGQGPNELFVIRVAGNVLAVEGVGSVAYALRSFPQVKLVVVMGHTDCGAVTAATRAYLDPEGWWDAPAPVRMILGRISHAVMEAANEIEQELGTGASRAPENSQKLLDRAIWINARRGAEDLRKQLHSIELGEDGQHVGFAYGVLDLGNEGVNLRMLDDEPAPTA